MTRTDSEYDEDAQFYDAFYSGEDDLQFYEGLAGRFGGPVLEPMCGTGRITVPLALAGYEICGIDSHPAMVGLARRKLAALPGAVQGRLTILEGDVRHFDLKRRFSLIIVPLSGFLHLLEPADQDSAVACFTRHLSENGALAIAVRNPGFPGRVHSERLDGEVTFGNGLLRRYSEITAQTDKGRLLVRHRWEVVEGKRIIRRAQSKFSLKLLRANQLKALMEGAGLRLAESMGGFRGEPLTPRSEWILHIARPRTGQRIAIDMKEMA